MKKTTNLIQGGNKMTFLKNKPFHFMLALIFTCATTKAIHADSIGVLKTPSQENSEVVVLGDKDFFYLERKEGVWHLMKRKTDRNWAEALALAGGGAVALAWAGAGAEVVAVAGDLAGAVAVAWAGAEAVAVAGGAVAGAVAWAEAEAGAVALAGTIFGIKFSKAFFIAQEDIKKTRMELRKILEENAQNDFGFTGMP